MISVDDLILNGIQVFMQRVRDDVPGSGGFFDVPTRIPNSFRIGEKGFYPSNIFMYTMSSDNHFFAIDELITYLDACGYQAAIERIKGGRASYDWVPLFIGNIEYISTDLIRAWGVDVSFEWKRGVSVRFTVADEAKEPPDCV